MLSWDGRLVGCGAECELTGNIAIGCFNGPKRYTGPHSMLGRPTPPSIMRRDVSFDKELN